MIFLGFVRRCGMDNFSAVERAKQARRKHIARQSAVASRKASSDPALRFGWAVTWIFCPPLLAPWLGYILASAFSGIWAVIMLACVLMAVYRGHVGPALRLLLISPLCVGVCGAIGIYLSVRK